MTLIGTIILIACGISIFTVKRENAPIIIMIACCYMTVGQQIQIAGANFPIFRFVILLGILRTIIRNEKAEGAWNPIDKMVLFYALWLLFASFFHERVPGAGPKYTMGAILNLVGTYYLFRVFLRKTSEIRSFIITTTVLLVPVGISMWFEQIANRNIFSFLGYIPDTPIIRNGRIRAQGPFSHPILAGSIGAAWFPLALSLWRSNRSWSIFGMVASLAIVSSSASSGPIMSVFFAVIALLFWNFKRHFSKLKWIALGAYIFLEIAMKKPVYYIISMIDLTGSSTGWHRSFLIDRTIEHLNEWWLFGTDRTVHWMPRQGRISDYHTDITNYYIGFGVSGGLLCMLAVISCILLAGKEVGRIANDHSQPLQKQMLTWCLGSALFANAATSMSVAFFGQAQVFFWIPIALITTIAYSPRMQSDQLT